jgi:histidinol-phosphate aminotransferase
MQPQPGVCEEDGLSLPIRAQLPNYHRDSYAPPAYSRARRGRIGSGDPAAVLPPEAATLLDCASGYGRFGNTRAVEAALRQISPQSLCEYPEIDYEAILKPALLARFRFAALAHDQLFLGHGSFNLMERVIHKLVRADTMLGVGPQFNEIPSEFVEAGGAYVSVPLVEPEYRLPVAELERELASRTVSMLYLDNPNNPTGQLFALADLERLADACERRGAVLLVDEAWGDYVEDGASAIRLVGSHPNLIVVRSFSKALGLAGERVGYMFLSAPLARYYREVDVPFEPSFVGATLARAVLDDANLIDEIRRQAVLAKQQAREAVEGVGFEVLPTHPAVAIMAVHSPARDIVVELRRRGIRVLGGSNFARTQPRWDDSYCRLSLNGGDRVASLCQRLSSR